MIIKEIEDYKTWTKFFNQNGSPSFLQSWGWGEIQKKLGYNILRLGLYDKDKLTAITLVVKIRAKRGNFLFIPNGPITQSQISNLKTQNYISNLKSYFVKLARKEDFSFIRIAPILENTPENQKIFKHLNFKTAPIYMHAETVWQLPLTAAVEERSGKTAAVYCLTDNQLLSNMRKTTRYLIRKAIRDGVIIEKRTDEKAVEDFYQIYQETAKREYFVPFSKKYIKEEFNTFNKTGNAIFLFGKINKQATGVEKKGFLTARSDFSSPPLVASTDGNEFETGPVASALILFTKSTAFYHQGASIHTKVPATYLLQWEAIKEAKKRGCSLYNFWGIYDENSGRMPKAWQGLTLFKTGFGGKKICYLPTQDYIISSRYFLTVIWEKLLAWKRVI